MIIKFSFKKWENLLHYITKYVHIILNTLTVRLFLPSKKEKTLKTLKSNSKNLF